MTGDLILPCPRCSTHLMEMHAVALPDGREAPRLDCLQCGWCEPEARDAARPDNDGSSLASLAAAFAELDRC